jgi:hypothetical protein
VEQSEIEKTVTDLEMRVDRLRSLYDQYFMGIERIPPAVSHKDVERRIQMMRKEQIRNTGLRFRFQMLIQRYNTYQSYWQRITRQIEEGTYKRDLVRAKRKVEAQEKVRASEAPLSIDVVVSEPPPPLEPPTTKMDRPRAIALDLDDLAPPRPAAPKVPPAAGSKPGVPVPPPSVTIPGARPVWRKVGEAAPTAPPAPTLAFKPAAPAVSRPPPVPTKPAATAPPKPPPQPAPATPPKPAPQPAPPAPVAKPQPAPPAPAAAAPKKPGDISEDRMRQLYADYVQTKRSQKESTASVTYDALARTIRDSTAKLKEKHGGKSVDFEVTVKDGKTILKPVVK